MVSHFQFADRQPSAFCFKYDGKVTKLSKIIFKHHGIDHQPEKLELLS